jgi:2-C-methyl-D-erythritol 4-phosphate cytidylyltransferase
LQRTLKEASADGWTIERTVPRDRLWRAQTPQGFPRQVLEAAHAAAGGHPPATDDAALIERSGGTVRLIPDSPHNFKITTADDLALAELWARHGERAPA